MSPFPSFEALLDHQSAFFLIRGGHMICGLPLVLILPSFDPLFCACAA